MLLGHGTPVCPVIRPRHHKLLAEPLRSVLRVVMGALAAMLLVLGLACREPAVGPLDRDGESGPALDHRANHPLPRSFQLVFNSDRAGGLGIFVMKRSGRDQMRVADPPTLSAWWSPDGTKIAFTSDRDGDFDIYVMDADGSNVTNLTNQLGDDGGPRWSPDGSKIAFVSARDGNLEVYVMDADGSNTMNLTRNPADDGGPGFSEISWSPDGTKIAFTSDRDPIGSLGIWVMDADGRNPTQLTYPSLRDRTPEWSPDGTRIAFGRQTSAGGAAVENEVYVIDADGSDEINLSNDAAGLDENPAWSPDGTRITFTKRSGSDGEIYIVNVDGTNLSNLTNNPAFDAESSWSPDGSKIVFVSDRDGNAEVYMMNPDGSNQRNLTNNPALDTAPSWRPME